MASNMPCANTHYLEKHEAEMEEADRFSDAVEAIVDEWCEDPIVIDENWDNLMDDLQWENSHVIRAFAADDPIRFFELIRIRYRALIHEQARDYVRDN